MRAVGLLVALAVGGCRSSPPVAAPSVEHEIPAPIVVGAVLPMTGASATFGIAVHDGIRIAINANQGGVELVVLDDQGKPGDAAVAGARLVGDEHVVALLGEVGSSQTAALASESGGVPIITPGGTDPGLLEIPQVRMIAVDDARQGQAAARFAVERGWTRVGILSDDSEPYSKRLADAFAAELDRLGGTVVLRERYAAGSDQASQLARLDEATVDLVFVPGYYVDVIQILTEARAIGMTMPFLGGDGWDSDVLFRIPAAAGTFFLNHFAVDDPMAADFVAAFREVHHRDPDVLAALGHDAAVVLLDAIARTESREPAALLAALDTPGARPLATGPLTHDSDHRVAKSMVVVQISGGARHYVARVGP